MVLKLTIGLLVAAFTVLTILAHGDPRYCVKNNCETLQSGEPQRKVDTDVIDEEPEPSDPAERAARIAKNVRYNGGGTDLTIQQSENTEIFFEHVWPAVDFIPAEDSALVVAGQVVKVQPYLSGDRSRIYTEITIAIDDLLKTDNNNRVAVNKTVVIDRPGGALKLRTGRIARDGRVVENLGKPALDKRYVFFACAVNDGKDVSLIKSYELLNGKVYTNDSRRSRLIAVQEGVPSTLTDEAAFLKAVREVTATTTGNAKQGQRPN
ncbi:MAG TPA: hypothetical protein VFY51_02870 [Pyrinomonadaceae bacterium]|nr:hypothetical protein [Pyrinomonadaceae bacterium]